MTSNHIGTAFQVFKEIADELGYNYSHGNMSESRVKAVNVYPFEHCTIQNVSIENQVTTIQFNITICDILNFVKTENQNLDEEVVYSEIGYTENTNYAHILQNLYVQFMLKLKAKEQEYFGQIQFTRPILMTPFIEGTQDVTAGYDIQLSIQVFSPFITDCYDEV
jgi:hypothetical protein